MASVVVRKMEESDIPEVSKLKLFEYQHSYVSPISNILKLLKSKPLTIPYVLVADGQIVGYVQFNTDYEDVSHYCDDDQTLGLEGFFIDQLWQGKKLAASFIHGILKTLTIDFPDYSKVALTVNCENPAAIRSYLNGGFTDTGRLYRGGRGGPQHIMAAKLKD